MSTNCAWDLVPPLTTFRLEPALGQADVDRSLLHVLKKFRVSTSVYKQAWAEGYTYNTLHTIPREKWSKWGVPDGSIEGLEVQFGGLRHDRFSTVMGADGRVNTVRIGEIALVRTWWQRTKRGPPCVRPMRPKYCLSLGVDPWSPRQNPDVPSFTSVFWGNTPADAVTGEVKAADSVGLQGSFSASRAGSSSSFQTTANLQGQASMPSGQVMQPGNMMQRQVRFAKQGSVGQPILEQSQVVQPVQGLPAYPNDQY